MEIKQQSQVAKRKIIMIALFPPPFSSGERILNKMNQEILEKEFEVITLNVSTDTLHPDRLNLRKIKNQLHILVLYFIAVYRAKQIQHKQHIHGFYMVTPGSRYGHVRDAIIFSLLGKKVKINIAFIQNGHIEKVFQKSWHAYFTAKLIQNVNHFVFTSKGLKEKVTGIPDEKKAILNNSVDPQLLFTEAELTIKRNKLQQAGPIRILYLSNMTQSKGFMDVALAVQKLHEMGKTATADFVGEWLSDDQMNEFKIFAELNGLSNIIHIHGKVNDRDKIKQFYRDAHFFVLPTYFSHEAQPVSIIEALNAGVPVISTNHASIPEMITDGFNGKLVPKKDPQAIVAAIEQILQENLWLQMSIHARNSFDNHFSREAYEKKLLTLFQ